MKERYPRRFICPLCGRTWEDVMDTLGAPLVACDAPCWIVWVSLQRVFAGPSNRPPIRLVARWSGIL